MGLCLIFTLRTPLRLDQRVRTAALVLAATLLGLLAPPGQADNQRQDLEHLRESVSEFLHEHYRQPGIARIEVEVGRLDQRLRLAHCGEPLTMNFNDPDRAGGNLTVHTRCPATAAWALYVPAQVSVYRPVATASRNLGRGHRIIDGDITLELKNTGRMRQGFVTGKEAILDMELRRPLREGEAFRMSILAEPLAVERGDQVRLRANAGPIEVHTSGTAMGSGRVGDQIRVRNDRSERVVRGRIVARGTVEVLL